jgi:hypothetical protein
MKKKGGIGFTKFPKPTMARKDKTVSDARASISSKRFFVQAKLTVQATNQKT